MNYTRIVQPFQIAHTDDNSYDWDDNSEHRGSYGSTYKPATAQETSAMIANQVKAGERRALQQVEAEAEAVRRANIYGLAISKELDRAINSANPVGISNEYMEVCLSPLADMTAESFELRNPLQKEVVRQKGSELNAEVIAERPKTQLEIEDEERYGYAIPEYKSMYESEPYEIPEYKSMYD